MSVDVVDIVIETSWLTRRNRRQSVSNDNSTPSDKHLDGTGRSDRNKVVVHSVQRRRDHSAVSCSRKCSRGDRLVDAAKCKANESTLSRQINPEQRTE